MAEEAIRRHFAAVCAAVKPGGAFLYVFQGPRLIPGQEESGATPVRNWKERDGKFILIDTQAGEIIEYRENQRAMAYAEVLSNLRAAGFTRVEAYMDFDCRPASAADFELFICEYSAGVGLHSGSSAGGTDGHREGRREV